ncbi:Maf-like protein [Actinocatenispora thailandica]|uniref:Nucleoside triphosphate pyrophosphatase n=1 Tax=Actinocatenispora thailandica TaxID=227318 RepID=A0A7R7HYN8_9ACTN|nr:Maf-like protein [Actinocatenispora thailandica]
MRFVLASQSPARLASLRAAGFDPEVIVSGVDESAVRAADTAALAGILARHKCEAVAARDTAAGAVVLGCDSVLEFEQETWGKPSGPADAVARWRRMRGHSGVLHTGHWLIDTRNDAAVGAVAATTVRFAEVSDAEIEAYVATGEPLAVAGAFTIDGRGGPFVSGVDGDPGTVVGVSLPLLRTLLADLDIPVTALWT